MMIDSNAPLASSSSMNYCSLWTMTDRRLRQQTAAAHDLKLHSPCQEEAMVLSQLELELQGLLRFRKAQVHLLKNGVRLQAIGGAAIDDLLLRASADRLALAHYFLEAAAKLRRMRPGSFRNSTSRSYYSIYHAARTVPFVFHAGDDHQDHKDLHNGIPDEFPDFERWRNDLKEARLRRNEADYDPYPRPDAEFADVSKVQLRVATDFLHVAEQYLRGKGCQL